MSRLSDLLCDWYALHGRDLPWRETHDPYCIWLSEVILQQTRVAQGMEYYHRFTDRFADVGSLAAASEDEVLRLWQGLGYYSRARNLHAAAKRIVGHFEGLFPTDYEQVRSLPGVGDYTAAAICSVAYDLPYAVVDGNVYRVLSRLFDLEEAIDSSAGKKLFAALAQEQLDPLRAGGYNQAIMDFGALQCTPAVPRCGECPLAEQCLAFAAGTIASRPVKRGRAKVRDRWFGYLHLRCGGKTLLRRRGAGDIWQGLYEFPLIEFPADTELGRVVEDEFFRTLCGDDRNFRLACEVVMPPHQLSHQRLHARFLRVELERWTPAAAEYVCVDEAALGDYAVPRLVENYLIKYPI